MNKGFIIAGTNSGCGKTTTTLGIMALLNRQGYRVAPFKVGPDYIDPGHHRRVTGSESRNLDGWMLSKQYNIECFNRGMHGKDIAVIEGVMGLYDGYDGKSDAGSTAQMAKWLDLPVILVVNAQSMARSAAALVKGFLEFDPDLRFAGIIFNRLGSSRHLKYLTDALEDTVPVPCLGGIFRNGDIEIPERHLGLVTDDDHGLSDEAVNRLADIIEETIDLSPLMDSVSKGNSASGIHPVQEKKVRIGVARDRAFCFYYRDNFDILEQSGAELVYFSPVEDRKLPENIDGIYFGGGYPELFAGPLSENRSLIKEIADSSNSGMPIYGECGGFMYLCREVSDPDGNTWPMTGCFPFTSSMSDRLRSLGYREVTLEKNSILGNAGDSIRGHEFHYSSIDETGETETLYRVTPRNGGTGSAEGYINNKTLGSYIHLHFGSRPETGKRFVDACMEYRNNQKKD